LYEKEYNDDDSLGLVIIYKVASNDMDVSDMNSFQFKNPSGPGSYVIEVNLDTDNGKTQYVGNLIVE